MSITAPLQPEVPSGDASRAVIEGLVDELTGLAVADARRFVAEARALRALRVAAEADDASMGWPVWVAEAALAQGVSEGSLRYRAERAAELLAHPALCTALDEALVGVPHALRLLETVAEAPPPIAVLAVAEALAAAKGRTLSPVEIAAVARRAWYRLDADAVARRRQAGLADRGLWFAHLIRPGNSQFGGTAAVEQALAAQQRLHTAAKTRTDPDDVRTCAQREADLAMALLTHGSLPDRALPEAQVQLTIHIPAATLTGDSDEPGVLTGAGLIDAHHARELAGSAALVPVTTDPVTGAVLARHETHTDEPPSGDSDGPAIGDAGRGGGDADAVSQVAGPAGRTPVQLAEAVRRLVELFRRPDGPSGQPGTDPGSGAGAGVGVPTVESQYRPSAGLTRFIRSRFTGCAAPSSTTWATDIEHPVAWPDGPTAGDRLTLIGRRWHRLKQAGYTYTPNPDASTTWTTPLGRSYTSAPPFTPPVLRDQPRDPDEPPPGPPQWARRELLRADPPRNLAELTLRSTPGEHSRAPGRDGKTGDQTTGSDPPGPEPPRPALPEEPPF